MGWWRAERHDFGVLCWQKAQALLALQAATADAGTTLSGLLIDNALVGGRTGKMEGGAWEGHIGLR